MIQSAKNRWNAFEHKWEYSLWFKTLKYALKAALMLIGLAMMIVGGFLSFFLSGDESDSGEFKGATHQDDRNADDIWKLTSGNDYYDQNPPDSFS